MRNLVSNQVKTSTVSLRGLWQNLPIAVNKGHLVRTSTKAFYLFYGSLDKTFALCRVVDTFQKSQPRIH